MDVHKTIYIKAAEIGIEHIQDGISYNEMKTILLETYGYKMLQSLRYEAYFRAWFYDNFLCYESAALSYVPNYENRKALKYSENWDDLPCILTAEAHDRYVDFIKFERAEETSNESKQIALEANDISINSIVIAKSANRLSKIAIWSSIFLGLIGLIISIIQFFQTR